MAIQWTEETAAHLYRRAAWGSTADELSEALRLGLEGTVARLVGYTSIPTNALDQKIAGLGLDLTKVNGIQRWWVIRMMFSPRPLEERMTFFWHDHFATALSKVNDPVAMLNQNNLFRNYALGNFRDLTVQVSKDPAMLRWLDNFTSVKQHPNENYGRELLELFTLGQGHYGESDVESAAKAFTGWGLTRTQPYGFEFRDTQHDHTVKTFLGQSGDWNGDDIVRIATGEFENARLIAGKLFAYFAYDDPAQDVIDRFARIYADGGTSVQPVVQAILLSPEMYSSKALMTKVKSPLDHVVMSTRQLLMDSNGGTAVSAAIVQGETPFNPPDVSGWDGGLNWINSGTLLSRMNFANTLTTTFDAAKFTAGQSFTTVSQLVGFYLQRLGPITVDAQTRATLERYVSPTGAFPVGSESTIKQRGLAHMILSLPEWQMK